MKTANIIIQLPERTKHVAFDNCGNVAARYETSYDSDHGDTYLQVLCRLFPWYEASYGIEQRWDYTIDLPDLAQHAFKFDHPNHNGRATFAYLQKHNRLQITVPLPDWCQEIVVDAFGEISMKGDTDTLELVEVWCTSVFAPEDITVPPRGLNLRIYKERVGTRHRVLATNR